LAIDGHQSQHSKFAAIQEALPKNPTGGLRLLSRGAVSVADACGMYGFGQIEDERPTTVVLRMVDRRIDAVGHVRAPELIAARDACVAELRSLR